MPDNRIRINLTVSPTLAARLARRAEKEGRTVTGLVHAIVLREMVAWAKKHEVAA